MAPPCYEVNSTACLQETDDSFLESVLVSGSMLESSALSSDSSQTSDGKVSCDMPLDCNKSPQI